MFFLCICPPSPLELHRRGHALVGRSSLPSQLLWVSSACDVRPTFQDRHKGVGEEESGGASAPTYRGARAHLLPAGTFSLTCRVMALLRLGSNLRRQGGTQGDMGRGHGGTKTRSVNPSPCLKRSSPRGCSKRDWGTSMPVLCSPWPAPVASAGLGRRWACECGWVGRHADDSPEAEVHSQTPERGRRGGSAKDGMPRGLTPGPWCTRVAGRALGGGVADLACCSVSGGSTGGTGVAAFRGKYVWRRAEFLVENVAVAFLLFCRLAPGLRRRAC